eukprot:6490006-Amphidinium_carterae.1
MELARRRPAQCQHPFLAIAVTTGAVSAHEDYNDSLTSLISLGSFSKGGALLLEDTVCDTHEKWVLVDARQTHQVVPYDGGKSAIAYYCPRDAAKLPTTSTTLLKRLGFPVAWWASERCWRQTMWTEENADKQDVVTIPSDLVAVDKQADVATPTDLVAVDKRDVVARTSDLVSVDMSANYPEVVEDEMGQTAMPEQAAHSSQAPPPRQEAILQSGDRVMAPTVQEADDTPHGDVGGLQEHEIEVPTKSQQSAILRFRLRMHTNLGHPDTHSFLRSLRIGGVRRGVRAWVRFRFVCTACAAWRPKVQRTTAHINDVHRFNMAVAVDNFHVDVPNVGKKTILHSICLGTRYQTAKIVAEGMTPTAENVLAAFVDSWVSVFGWPQAVLVDVGVEFRAVFRDTLEHHGVYVGVINSQAPHEKGICERAGGRLKELLHLTFEDTEPLSELDVKVSLAAVTSAHNRFYDRSGYSPAQRVMGQSPVYPDDLLSDRHPDADVMAVDGSVTFERTMAVRAAALRAFVSHSVKQRLSRAAAAHS